MTLRQLWCSYQSSLLHEWDHTSSVMMTLAAGFGGTKAKLKPDMFHPFRGGMQKTIRVGKGNMEPLAAAFLL